MRKSALFIGLLAACGTEDSAPSAPQIGTGDRSPSSVTFTVIAGPTQGLQQPRDLGFNPLRPDELWVVNYDDDSAVIVFDAPHNTRAFEKRVDGYALHFMEQVTGIAFGADYTTFGLPGTFGTCGESRNTYNNRAQPNDFMGPALWSSDLMTFAKHNLNGLGSHLDVLHNTPLCMGIAHESENKYWVFNGLAGSIDRYDFVTDDGIGNDNHLDGLTWRYAEGQVMRVENIPSHLWWDADTSTLYIADTGNARIAKLDGLSGTAGAMIPGDETPITPMSGATLETVASGDINRPAGLELYEDLLFVTDHAASRILAYELDGTLVNYLDTGLPANSLGGLTFGPDGKLYFVDMVGDQVLRVDP